MIHGIQSTGDPLRPGQGRNAKRSWMIFVASATLVISISSGFQVIPCILGLWGLLLLTKKNILCSDCNGLHYPNLSRYREWMCGNFSPNVITIIPFGDGWNTGKGIVLASMLRFFVKYVYIYIYLQISVISPHPNPNPCQINNFFEFLVNVVAPPPPHPMSASNLFEVEANGFANGFATPHPHPTPSHVS